MTSPEAGLLIVPNNQVVIHQYYWNDTYNFGDQLNPLIIEKLSGRKVVSTSIDRAKFVAIGSVLQSIRCKKYITSIINSFLNPVLTIWGSGFLDEQSKYHYLKRKVKVSALRGKLSKIQMTKLLNSDNNLSDIALGDPGLLANILLDKSPEKIYDLGIISHWEHKGLQLQSELQKNIPNSIIIDISADVSDTLHKIASCKSIISSAMHGLIVADSLNIPNQWVSFGALLDDYKFKDYYSVYDLTPEVWDLTTMKFDPEKLPILIKENYKILPHQVENVRQNLLEKFPY